MKVYEPVALVLDGACCLRPRQRLVEDAAKQPAGNLNDAADSNNTADNFGIGDNIETGIQAIDNKPVKIPTGLAVLQDMMRADIAGQQSRG